MDFPISSKTIEEINLLYAIAKANGSLLSLRDITTLTTIDLTEEQLEARWRVVGLTTNYEISSGFLLERNESDTIRQTSLSEESARRRQADLYTNFALRFVSQLKPNELRLIAVSGSTSYQAVRETDDLDFFCVTGPDSMWIFLTRTLILSRLSRTFRRGAPGICLSYVVDSHFAEKNFSNSQDALFARDALTATVIQGKEFYVQLLRTAHWISNFFPGLYKERTLAGSNNSIGESEAGQSRSTPGRKCLNLLLFKLVGNYIAIKSFILNLRFKKDGNENSRFEARVGPDHCIFESFRYVQLRSLYAHFHGTTVEKKAT